ncbi:MAG: hypothetical protein ACKVTZ_20650 [Bacteroidia bacterium]
MKYILIVILFLSTEYLFSQVIQSQALNIVNRHDTSYLKMSFKFYNDNSLDTIPIWLGRWNFHFYDIGNGWRKRSLDSLPIFSFLGVENTNENMFILGDGSIYLQEAFEQYFRLKHSHLTPINSTDTRIKFLFPCDTFYLTVWLSDSKIIQYYSEHELWCCTMLAIPFNINKTSKIPVPRNWVKDSYTLDSLSIYPMFTYTTTKELPYKGYLGHIYEVPTEFEYELVQKSPRYTNAPINLNLIKK